jgi:RND superfamily putative drug exporter
VALLGRWNWWAPAPLRRLHARIGIGEGRGMGSAARTGAAA